MQRKQLENVAWLEFDLLSSIPHLKHGVFLRHGGFSQGVFASLNLSDRVGDEIEHVQANVKKVKSILGIKTLISNRQVHGKEILLASDVKKSPSDGLVTNTRGEGVMVHHADCQAAIIYDPIQKVVSTVHCGWRGSVQNIYREAVEFLKKTFLSKPENLLVCISPSLGPECAEFVNYRTELPEHFWDYQIKPNYFDFWAITEMQLTHCGILKNHMEFARICTYSNPLDCYSYRRSKIRGGHGTIAVMV